MKLALACLFIFISSFVFSQEEELVTEGDIDTIQVQNAIKNPLKASLYSAILPGFGQAYNKQYWKIPVVWATVGGGIAFIVHYNNRYRFYRDGFLASLNGDPTGFPDDYTTEILARAQDDQRRNRDYAIVITSLLYAMNILDAIVSAHLSEMKYDKDLAVSPVIINLPRSQASVGGIGIKFNF